MSADDDATPPDPAGTQPRVDRDALLPARVDPPVDAEAEEEPPPGPLPEPIEDRAPGEPAVRHEAPHAARFQFILGALLAIGAMAIFLLIWAVGQTSTPEGEQWSPWKPSGSGLQAAQEIAAHVGPQYKGSNGKQLVLVTANGMSIGQTALELVRREEGGEANRIDGDAIRYELCGLGERCAIRGKPTNARGMLLRREAIEIAGYTFRYLPDIDQVVFHLPPGPLEIPETALQKGQTVTLGNQVLLFRRNDLEPLLRAPLRATLAAPPPTPSTIGKSEELPIIEALVSNKAFFYSLSQAQSDDAAFLVLDSEPQPEQIREAAEQKALQDAARKAARKAGAR